MEDYIDRNQIKYTNSPVGAIASKLDISNILTADVVERSKYDNLHNLAKSWLEEKKELEKANDELRSKVEEAIEEMERFSIAADYEGKKEVSKAIDKCIEILK